MTLLILTTSFFKERFRVACSCEIEKMIAQDPTEQKTTRVKVTSSRIAIESNQRTRQVNSSHGEKSTRRKKIVETEIGIAKAPARRSPEIPILMVLARSPVSGVKTADVLKELKSPNWFPELSLSDLSARYPESKKKVVDTIIKFGRKRLVIRGEIYPLSPENPTGIWRITQIGLERLKKERASWLPKYSIYTNRIVEV